MDVLMNVRRFMRRILLHLGRKGTEIRRKKKARVEKAPPIVSEHPS
jgi:hypothetical protein